MGFCPPLETELTLPSFGKVRLRPKEDENDPAESKAKKKIVSDSQKRSGEDLEGQPATRTTFTNDAMNASMEEKARMLTKKTAEDDEAHGGETHEHGGLAVAQRRSIRHPRRLQARRR